MGNVGKFTTKGKLSAVIIELPVPHAGVGGQHIIILLFVFNMQTSAKSIMHVSIVRQINTKMIL